ncbi:MAG: carbohydrate binding domain-containing protein, partial [Planctomycetes bacterium]|nr:carbohydrate binding domain-containing protein [Planctomycetota bacterium]
MSKKLIYFVCFVFAFGLCGPIASGQENQIINGEFDDGLNSWGSYGSAGFTLEVVSDAGLSGSNAALINVTDASATASIGLPQGGFDLVQGETYPFGFTAKADQDREMVVLFQLYKPEGPSWIDIILTRVSLTTEAQSFVLEYTHVDDSTSAHPAWEVNMYLMLKGQWWAMTGSDMNSKVWIDRVFFGAEPPVQQRNRAMNPNPADEATDVPRDVVLSWAPGESAATTNGHKVYFGQSFNDVNDATGGITQDANSYTPAQRLDFSKTYYWRIDEVNA